MSSAETIEFEIDPDDEFGGDYDEPGRLRPEDVTGTVVYTLDWTVKTVVDQIDADPDNPETTGVLVTSPPFQRRTAWDADRQSLFIESLMLGLPVPPLVLAESLRNPGQFYVLDGKQRLTSLRLFIKEGSLRLRNLELLDELDGLSHEDIMGKTNRRKYVLSMLSQPVRTIVVRNWGTPALLHLIFARLNKATVPLASHELRQAIYPGPLTNYVNRVSAESLPLRRARRLKAADFRLRDAETLLRFISLKTNLPKYRGDLRDFLDRCLKGGNEHFTQIEQELDALVREMEAAIDAVFLIFEERSFLRFDRDRQKYMPRFNVAVFDIMTWHLAHGEVRVLATEKAEVVVRAFEDLCSDHPAFSNYLTSTTKSPEAVLGRLTLWGEAMGRALGMDLSKPEAHVLPFLPIAPAVVRR